MASISVICPDNEWKLVAENVKQGRIRPTLTNPTRYVYDVVPTGSPIPSPTMATASAILPFEEVWNFQFRASVDIYIYAFDQDGRVDYDDDTPYTDVVLTDITGNELSTDSMTQSLTVIDIHASKLHQGDSYYIKGYLELDTGDTFYVKVVTPVTKELHFSFSIKSTGILTTSFDEGATGGMTGGTGVIPLNRNRNSGNTSETVVTSGVTNADSYTTRLVADKWGAVGFKTAIGGEGSTVSEYLLKKDTTYLRSYLSGENDNIIQFEASWVELVDLT